MSRAKLSKQESAGPARLFVGHTITEVRPMTKQELKSESWDSSPRAWTSLVLVLSNGVKLFASSDSEGNNPGVLFGRTKDGDGVYVTKEPKLATSK